MNKWIALPVLGLLAVVSIAIAQQGPAAGPKPEPAPADAPMGPLPVVVQAIAPQQWQYEVVQFPLPVEQRGVNEMRDAFNQRGRQGWELVSGVEFQGRATYIFRQPVLAPQAPGNNAARPR